MQPTDQILLFFEKYRELAGKAANLRAREYPDYLKQFGQEIEI